jgi:hypothetical protein
VSPEGVVNFGLFILVKLHFPYKFRESESLKSADAAERLNSCGPNALPEKKGKPAWLRFLAHFNDVNGLLPDLPWRGVARGRRKLWVIHLGQITFSL